MWLGRLRRSLSTSIWRFTLTFTGIVLCICIAILMLVYHFTIGEQKQQLSQQVIITAQGLSDLAKAEGIDASSFRRTVQHRVDKSASVLLVLDTSDTIIGNLGSFPDNLPTLPELKHFPVAVVDHLGQTSVIVALGGQMQTQFGSLLVGMFDDNYQAREVEFRTASIWALVLTLLVTLITGFLFNRKVLSRVNQMGQFIEEVKSGHLKTRLPLSARHDEFDTIAQQINLMLDEIDNLIDSVAQVTDNIAHDLRTPLSRIHISIEEKLQEAVEGSQDEQWQLALLDDLDNVIATFNAMLELSRIEKGVQPALFVDVDVFKLCEDAIELAMPLAEQKSQSLNFFFELQDQMSSLPIKGEPNLLFRAIFNLLDNAIKYTPDAGEVQLALKFNPNHCELIVSDNGPGIPKELQEKVFQRLYRIESSRQSKGFGLGLPIVKAIVEFHGGVLQIKSGNPGLVAKVILEY